MTKHSGAVSETQSADAMLRAGRPAVVPGGMWGHLNAARLPEGYPQFFASAEGCRVRDVDGREYIDFMCSWGPVLLGHRHPEVQAAADAQAALGDCFNGPGEVMVELAEDFVAMVPHADWAMFQKNGGDATTACVTIARAGTGRRKVLVATRQLSRRAALVLAERGRRHHRGSRASRALRIQRRGEPAGGGRSRREATSPRSWSRLSATTSRAISNCRPREFAAAARAACDAAGAALILDEVRAGLRLDIRGSWEALGVRPDLCRLEQGDRQRLRAGRRHRQRPIPRGGHKGVRDRLVLVRHGGDGGGARPRCGSRARPMCPAISARWALRLREGLASLANENGIAIRQSGPPQMPLMLFDARSGRSKGPRVLLGGACATAHSSIPLHNMFLSSAHSPPISTRRWRRLHTASRPSAT